MAADLRVGTSGWHYPGGEGSWNGPFYPKPRPRGFDELAYYAEHFDTVEINTTFYGQPRPEVSRAWVARTPPGFEFAVKLYQKFTHPRMFQERVRAQLAKALGAEEIPEDTIRALIEANQADLDVFRRGIEPLADAGRLGVLLAQFPPSFHDTAANRAHLATLLRAFHGHALAVELRHRTWSDAADDTWRLLDAFGAAWLWIDEPRFKDSIAPPGLDRGPLIYLRLHGRNAGAWWKGSRDDRYNYLYAPDELGPIADQMAGAIRGGRRGRAYVNNHYSAKAVVNARTLEELTRARLPELAVARRRGGSTPAGENSVNRTPGWGM